MKLWIQSERALFTPAEYNGLTGGNDMRPHDDWRKRWTFDPENLTLSIPSLASATYDVDLERCNDSAQVLDWILQVSHKTWASPEDIGYLVYALDELAGGLGLQEKVCPGGVNKKFEFGAHLHKQQSQD